MAAYVHPTRTRYQPPPQTTAGRLYNRAKSPLRATASAIGTLLFSLMRLLLWLIRLPFRSRRTLICSIVLAVAAAGLICWLTYRNPIERAAQARAEVDRRQVVVVNTLATILSDGAYVQPSVQSDEPFSRCHNWIQRVLERQESLDNQLRSYRQELRHAGKAYRRAAWAYDWLAWRTSSQETLAQGYTLLSQHASENAVALDARAQTIAESRAALRQRLRFLQDSMLFLERVDFFETVHGPRSTHAYSIQIEAFTREAAAVRALLITIATAISGRSEAVSSPE